LKGDLKEKKLDLDRLAESGGMSYILLLAMLHISKYMWLVSFIF
jgi:hypothetical protein